GGRPPTASNVPGCDVVTTQQGRAVRMTIIRIGLDTSKHVFQIHGVDENEKPVLRRQLRRLASLGAAVARLGARSAADAAAIYQGLRQARQERRDRCRGDLRSDEPT